MLNIVEIEKKPAVGEDLHDELEMESRIQEWGAGYEYDDSTGVHLDPHKVVVGKLKGLQKVKGREVYVLLCGQGHGDGGGNSVKTRWVLPRERRCCEIPNGCAGVCSSRPARRSLCRDSTALCCSASAEQGCELRG